MLYFFISITNFGPLVPVLSPLQIHVYKIMHLYLNFIKLYELAMVSPIKTIFSGEKTMC